MTTDEVLEEVKARGLDVVVIGGEPRLRGDRAKLSPILLTVLRWHRQSIIERLTPLPPREWLWRAGHAYAEADDDRHGADWNPVGAWWWRRRGEPGWRLVAGACKPPQLIRDEHREHLGINTVADFEVGKNLPHGHTLLEASR